MKCRTKCCQVEVENKKHSPYCSKCGRRRFKEAHPMEYSFNEIRSGARRRGKDFSLTLDQFAAFAVRTDYLKLKGKTALSLSIDRIDNAQGYHHWNIQAITLRENTRKDHAPRLKA